MAIVALNTSDDCGVSEAAPAVNQDGNDLLCSVNAVGGERWRFYCKWDISSIPAGAEILAVRIGLYVQSAGKEGTFPLELDIEQITVDDWAEATITWNNQPGGAPPGELQFDQPDVGSNYWKWIGAFQPLTCYLLTNIGERSGKNHLRLLLWSPA